METGHFTDTMPTRASLLVRLRDFDDARSWGEFFQRYRQRVTRVALGQGLRAFEAEDVAQEVFKRVARSICDYEFTGRPGSFRRWLFNLTRWRATDQLRERSKFSESLHRGGSSPCDVNTSDRTSTIERIPAPLEKHAAGEAEERRYVLDSLLKQIERAVTPKQLQIFQLLVLDEVEPAEVAKLYKMTLTAVYVTRHRVAAKLREEMSRLNLTSV